MTHLGTQYIETDRLVLRKLERSDAQSFLDNIAADDEVTKFLAGWPENCTVPMMEEILDRWISQYSDLDCYNWAIVWKENGFEAIGQVIVFYWDEITGAPNLGCCLGRRWWNQGIMTEALGTVIDYLLDRVGVARIEAYCDQENHASQAVIEKCGMKYEITKDWAGCYAIGRGER